MTFVIVSLFLSHLVFGQGYYSRPHKEEFREAVNYIAEHEHLYEDPLIIGYAWHQDYFNYYFARKGSVARVNIISGRKEDIPNITKIISIENPRYIWYIRVHRKPDAEFMAFLNKRLVLIEHNIFYKSEVRLFRNEQVE